MVRHLQKPCQQLPRTRFSSFHGQSMSANAQALSMRMFHVLTYAALLRGNDHPILEAVGSGVLLTRYRH